MKNFKFLSIVFLISLILTGGIAQQGKVTGGSDHSMPGWFKDSFLDLTEDIEEAKDEDKHLMLFMSLKFCPYCTKMIHDSFTKGTKLQPYIQKNFDVVGIDIKGVKEVTVSEDVSMTEKEYAQKIKVQYTPTIIVFDQNGKIVVRVNGYRSSENFKYILDFVKNKAYKNTTLTQYLEKVKNKTLYKLKNNKNFLNISNLSEVGGPLAVIFEDGSCTQCDYLHNVTLKNKDVLSEMKKFTIVRYDSSSTQKITTPKGKVTTPNQWAKDIALDYRPGILLFDEKEEIARIDALLYSFHFKELFRYVSGKHYDDYETFLPYLGNRQQELLSQGVNIDISDK